MQGCSKNVASKCLTRREIFFQTLSASLLVLSPAQARNLPEQFASQTDISRQSGRLEALIPIVQLQDSMLQLQSTLLKDGDLKPMMQKIPTNEASFKALFDKYSDPVSYKQQFLDKNAFLVYYTQGFDGPGRPSIESDVPIKQSNQYGARNEAWVAWQECLDEYAYRQKGEEDVDMLTPLSKVLQALDRYLSQAPPQDVERAKSMIQQQK